MLRGYVTREELSAFVDDMLLLLRGLGASLVLGKAALVPKPYSPNKSI